MAITKNRINVSLPDASKRAIYKLARHKQVPPATFAAQLIETALELEEDQVWDALAAQRDTADARFVSHKTAWS